MEKKDLQQIIDRCVEWDRESQEALYRYLSDGLFKVCLYYAKDKSTAEDFLHDSFIHLFKNIQKYKGEGSFEGWARRLTVNVILGQLRANKEFASEIGENILEEIDSNEEENKIPLTTVLEEINNLPSKAAMVIKLYAVEGWTHKEIAESLGISEGTSKSQLSYARTVLKRKLSFE